MRISDWSSDVCSSDLIGEVGRNQRDLAHAKVTGRVRREDETQEAFVGTRQGADQIHALVGDIGQEAHIALAVGKAPGLKDAQLETPRLGERLLAGLVARPRAANKIGNPAWGENVGLTGECS